MTITTLYKILRSLIAKDLGALPVVILKESLPAGIPDEGVVANIQDHTVAVHEAVDAEGNLRRSPRGSTISKKHLVLTAWENK